MHIEGGGSISSVKCFASSCSATMSDDEMCHPLPVYIEFSVAVKSAAAFGCGFLLWISGDVD